MALPLLIMMSLAMLHIFGMVSREHRNFLGDWELVQQVCYPMQEIGNDVRYCRELTVKREDGAVTLGIKRHHLVYSHLNQTEIWQRYKFTHLEDGSYWITKDTQPVLGRTSLTDVQLDFCDCELLDYDRVRVFVSGVNKATGHRFKLERTFYTYGYGLKPELGR